MKHLSAAQPAGRAPGKPLREQAAEEEAAWKQGVQMHTPALGVNGQL